MAIYNLTNLSAANNIYEVTKSASEATGGQLIVVLYFATFYTLFAIYKGRSDTIGTITFASFGVSMLGIVLFVLGWIQIVFVAAPIAVFTLSFIARFALSE